MDTDAKIARLEQWLFEVLDIMTDDDHIAEGTRSGLLSVWSELNAAMTETDDE